MQIRTRHAIFLICFLLVYTSGFSQTKEVVEKHDYFTEKFHVNDMDSTVKEGFYMRYYKSKVVEKGNYLDDKRVGNWRFYNLGGIFEYEFNYENGGVNKLSGAYNEPPYEETPVLFKGSPLDPYLFIVKNINYPKEAFKDEIKGRVTLALEVNSKGRLIFKYIDESLHPLFDNEVLRVANLFPDDWQWLPATKRGKPVDGLYLISIDFELYE